MVAMKQYFDVGVTLRMEVESEAHALALRNKILGVIADFDFKKDGLWEICCTEPCQDDETA